MVFTCGIESSDYQNPECCLFTSEKESLSITVHEIHTIFPALFRCLHAQRPCFLLINLTFVETKGEFSTQKDKKQQEMRIE